MSGKYKSFIFLFVSTLIASTLLRADITISADKSSTIPFPFTIKPYAYNSTNTPDGGDLRQFFVGASQAPTGEFRDRSISVVRPSTTFFVGITPEKTTLDGSVDQPNPLYGSIIDQLTLLSNAPLVVSAVNNRKLYAVRDYMVGSQVISSAELTDFANLPCNGIIALGGLCTGTTFLAAVLPNGGGAFGTANSALVVGDIQLPTKDNKTYKLNIGSKAAVDINSPALMIDNPLNAILTTAPIIYPCEFTREFYTGLSVQTNGILGSGARCIIYGLNNKIAPDAAITDDSIVGGRTILAGTPVDVCAHQVSVLFTSTYLTYLVIVGGVGNPATTTKNVYALPLVAAGDFAGQLANKNAPPANVYPNNATGFVLTGRLLGRAFLTPATVAGTLFSPTDADIYRARVGGNNPALLPGDISSIFVEKDTVFVTVAANSANEPGGIFASQAIFEPNGRIVGFTDWRRAAGPQEPIVATILDNVTGSFTFLPGDNPNTLHTVRRTLWGCSTFYQNLENLFKDITTGIQYTVDFPRTNASFSQIAGNRLSLLCSTGYKCVALAQSGSDDGVLFKGATGLSNTFISTTGSTVGFTGAADSILFSGGVLDEMGALIAADIVSTATNNWLFVGGNGGLVVLMAANGAGWPVPLTKNFNNLPATLTFKKIGGLRNVRKIIADTNNDLLYVLTTDQLVRFDVTDPNFPGSTGTLLASFDTLPKEVGTFMSFSDVAISGPVALLAGDNGLLRVGNNHDISTATSTANVAWTTVTLPEGVGPVTRLFVISATGRDIDFATDIRGGNIYLLNACVSLHQTRMYRIAIAGNTVAINNYTVQLFADHFYQDVNPTFFYDRGDYRNFVASDGAMIFMSRSFYYPFRIPALLESLDPALRTSVLVNRTSTQIVSPNTAVMGPILRRSATGSWMVSGGHLYAND